MKSEQDNFGRSYIKEFRQNEYQAGERTDQKRDDGEIVGDVHFKYKIEGDKLILKSKDLELEGYPKGEKIYTKKTSL